MKLRIGCLQFNPSLGNTERNIDAIKKILHASPTKPDLLILPELAVTGYNFANSDDISGYLEDRENGKTPSITLAKQLSLKYNCFTLLGYPERYKNTTYNSSIFIGPDGSELYNYRKTHLYETDEVWGCKENPSTSKFEAIDVIFDKLFYSKKPEIKSNYKSYKVNIGICMDLNPYQFKAPFNLFEFSILSFNQEVDLILCPMAWLSPLLPSILDASPQEKLKLGAEFEDKHFGTAKEYVFNLDTPPKLDTSIKEFIPSVPDCSTVDYWILRFFPFLAHEQSFARKYFLNVTVVTCNRVGVEREVVYGGSSSIFQFSRTPPLEKIDHTNPSVDVLGSLGQGEEGILIREVALF